jgi:hypothetical protein
MAKTHSRTLTQPYEAALRRVLQYLLDNEPIWHGERLDFEEGDLAQQADHIFPSFLAMHAWLERGTVELHLAQIVATPGAVNALSEEDISGALARHQAGDWGSLTDEDWEANDRALEEGERLLSVYFAKNGTRFWIITEADRSATTVLLPEDY